MALIYRNNGIVYENLCPTVEHFSLIGKDGIGRLFTFRGYYMFSEPKEIIYIKDIVLHMHTRLVFYVLLTQCVPLFDINKYSAHLLLDDCVGIDKSLSVRDEVLPFLQRKADDDGIIYNNCIDCLDYRFGSKMIGVVLDKAFSVEQIFPGDNFFKNYQLNLSKVFSEKIATLLRFCSVLKLVEYILSESDSLKH